LKKLKKAFAWILAFTFAVTLISVAPATVSNAAVDFNAMPIPTLDTYQNGYNIARTMYLLESSTAQKPNTVRIAVTGQSISDSNNVWVPNLITWLRGKYPTANIIFQNFAIGGFATQTLYKRVPNDMASFFPDLVILYDYGDHTLYDRMVKYMRQTIGAEVMMQTEHYTGANDWSDTMSYSLLPTIATKYGAELCRLREPWKQYLATYGLQPSVLLLDGVHLNPDGQTFMLGLMKQFFVYRPSNAATVIASQTKTVQPSDWVNGKLSMTYKGTRAEVISGTGTQHATNILVDTKAPSTYKENYIRSAESNGMWSTILGIINYNAVPLEQTWTVEMTSYTNEKTFALKASGSISGDQGTSVNNVLNGPILKLDFESFIWGYTPATVGTKYTFTSILNGCDSYNGSKKVLYSGMPNANHTLELTAANIANIPDIKAIQFYDPSSVIVTDALMPTIKPSTPTPTPVPTPTPDPNATPTPDPILATIDPTNLLAGLNCDFEAGGWGTNLVEVTTDPGQGTKCASAIAQGWTGIFKSSPILLENTYYTLSYLVKTDGTAANLAVTIGYADSTSEAIKGGGESYTGSDTTWTRYFTVFKTGPGIKKFDPFNYTSVAVWSATTVWIDDIQLHRGFSVTPPPPATPTPTVAPVTATPTVAPVTPTPPVVGADTIKLNKTSATLSVPKTLQLIATVGIPFIASNEVKWTSSNSKIATVSSNGKVTAKLPGIATITATTVTQGKKATCKVTVVQPVISVKLSKTSLTVMKGKTSKLTATINPKNASNKKVIWKSGNKSIVTVSSLGVVKGIKKGSAYVYVYTVSGNKSARCKVTVK